MDTRWIGAAVALLLLTACGDAEVEGSAFTGDGGVFSEVARAPHGEGPAPLDDGKPCRRGRKTTLAEARSAVDFAVVVPSHARANEKSVREVWQCPTSVNKHRVVRPDGSTETPDTFQSQSVVLLFDSGVRIYQELSLDFAHADWKSSAASNGGSVGTVHGRPAWLLPPEAPDGHGGVFFVENEVMVRVIGNGELLIDALHEIAESLTP